MLAAVSYCVGFIVMVVMDVDVVVVVVSVGVLVAVLFILVFVRYFCGTCCLCTFSILCTFVITVFLFRLLLYNPYAVLCCFLLCTYHCIYISSL